MIWRIVAEDLATLKEVNTYYDLVDVIDANIVLDMKLEMAEAEVPRGSP